MLASTWSRHYKEINYYIIIIITIIIIIIVKEMKNLHARDKMLIRNFTHRTDDVKITLFTMFCSNIYCCPLWYNFRSCFLKKIHIAYNKAFKTLMKKPREYSVSGLFVECHVDNVPVLRRKHVYGLGSRGYGSSNVLVNTFLYVNHGLNPMHRYWKTLLHLCILFLHLKFRNYLLHC